MADKKRILTGLTPSAGQLHIGNYFGCIKPMLDLQKKEEENAEMFLFLSNMHAMTKILDGEKVRENSFGLLKLYLACGADPKKFFIYNQADVPAHAQLCRVLQCVTHM